MAGKRYREIAKGIDRSRSYSLEEAIRYLVEHPAASFDETIEMAIRLNVDPRQADQNIRSSVVLPHGLGKKVRVLVLAKGEKENEAREAGADYVGGEELVKKIQEEGWLDFDRVIATPDIMNLVGRVGRILGPRGLMPNPKTGTVTFDVKQAVAEAKAGKVDYRVDRAGVVHAPIGKRSFGVEKLVENAEALLASVIRAKPASAKGNYIKSVAVSSTMGPGIEVDLSQARTVAARAA